MTNNIIKEGGVAGHMNHLYENPHLTFEEMKDIIQKATAGELEGTEKTDGQNLFISYSARSGKAVAARNKGNIKSGGLDAAGLAKKFKDRGALENAFNDAFSAFEQAASKLSSEAQLKLFGSDAEIYYNSEVQDPESPNVIHYDEPNLVIHKVGHVKVVDIEGKKELKPFNIKGVDHFFNELIRYGDEGAEAQRFRLQKNAVRKLEAISDGTILDATLEKLERELNKVGISDNQTVMEYVVARIKPLLQNIELPEEQYEMFVRRILSPMTGEKGLTKVMITKGAPPEMKQQVNKVIDSAPALLKDAIRPLENLIHDFTVEVLRGLESAFILDNKKEIKRLQGKVSNAINAIESSGEEEKIAVLRQQMEKLKGAENVTAAAEGFVFDYNGVTYKFTGNFAPANQVLGLFKFGRKGSTPMKDLFMGPGASKGEADFWYGEQSPVQPYPLQEGFDPDRPQHIVMIPGGFKPPHRGHLKMVKDAMEKANPKPDRIVLFTGEEKRDDIGVVEGLQIWQVYLRNEGLSGFVDLYAFKPMAVAGKFKKGGDPVISKSPMVPMYKEAVALPQDSKVTFISSTEDPGHGKALKPSIEKARPDIEVDSIVIEADLDPKTGDKYSATYMRLAIQKNDYERFLDFMPDSSKGQAHYIWAQILDKGEPIEAETEESDLIDEMINEMFINEFSSMAGGDCAGHTGETENEGLIREEGDEEMHLEDKLRRVIKDKIKIKMKKYGKQVIEEQKFRKIVRSLLKEAAMEDTPSRSTGINKLVGALKIVLPVIERAYKGLTTSAEQRNSFKKHLTKAIIDTLSPEAALRGADLGPDGEADTEDDLLDIQEQIKVNVDPDMADIDAHPKGINIDVADSEPTKGADAMAADEEMAAAEEEENKAAAKVSADEDFEDVEGQERAFPTIPGLDETGRDEAVDIYKRVIDAIVRTYRRLHDERDRNTYQDYLVTNLLLYFDKWESDISGEIDDISTPEYEKHTQEKERFGAGAEEAPPEEEPLAEQILVRLREMDII